MRAALLICTIGALGATTAHAQAPTSFPGQQPAPAPAPQPAAAPEAVGPSERLEASEHTCETLFGPDVDDRERDSGSQLDDDERCFREEDTRWRWSLGFFTGPTRDAEWDDSLAARGYGPSDVQFGGETSLMRRLGGVVAIGARTSVRDLRWLHYERPSATVFGWDLMIAADLRLSVGRTRLFAVGLDVAGGLGLAFSRVNDGRSTDVGYRVQAGGLLSLRIVGPAAFTIRIGYDHFPVSIGGTLDAHLGGARFTFALEIVE